MPRKQTTILTLTVLCLTLLLSACNQATKDEQPSAQENPPTTLEKDAAMTQVEQDLRIDYIEFATINIEDTKKFYSTIFDWKFTDYGPTYTSFTDGRLNGGFTITEEVKSGGPLVVIYVADLESLPPKVEASGGKIVREIFEFPGGRRFHFADPSGNELAAWSDK